jgi:hypothetical protein
MRVGDIAPADFFTRYSGEAAVTLDLPGYCEAGVIPSSLRVGGEGVPQHRSLSRPGLASLTLGRPQASSRHVCSSIRRRESSSLTSDRLYSKNETTGSARNTESTARRSRRAREFVCGRGA